MISAPRPAQSGRGGGVGLDEGRGVLPRGEVLDPDVPVHPQVAHQLHADLAGSCVTFVRRREEDVERRLEVSLLNDSPLDGRNLIIAFDALSNLASDRRVTAGVPHRRLGCLARGLELLASVLADRLRRLRRRPPWPSVCTRALSTSDSSSSSNVPPCSPQTTSRSARWILRRERPCRRNTLRSDSVRSEWLQSIVARSVLWRSGVSLGPEVSTSRARPNRARAARPERGGAPVPPRARVPAADQSRDGDRSPRPSSAFSGSTLERRRRHLAPARRAWRDRGVRRYEACGRDRGRRDGERQELVFALGGDPERRSAGDDDPELGTAFGRSGYLRRRGNDLLQVVQKE